MTLGDFFLEPGAWPLLAAVPLVWIVLRLLDRRRARRVATLVGPRAPALTAELHPGERRLRTTLSSAGALLALLAVMQPTWGDAPHQVDQRGQDVILCLDVSRSMLARDVTPSRLAAAQRQIRTLAARLHGDRLALVVFAGEARLLSPLTRDLGSFTRILELADPLAVRRGGTDLRAALELALASGTPADGGHETVVLLTDGEDLAGEGLRAAEECRRRGVPVHCVGFGSTVGSKIAIESDGGESFLRDPGGQDVVSAMNPNSLRAIAAAAGGDYLDGASSPDALADLYERRILPSARKSFAAEARRERENRFQWPLLLALACWIAELCLTDRRKQ